MRAKRSSKGAPATSGGASKSTRKGATLSQEQRDFVDEYMVDMDAFAAARRIGYARLNAKPFVRKIMAVPAVAQEIQRRIDNSDPKAMFSPQRVIAGFMREAANPYNSGTARIQALRALAEVQEMQIGPGRAAKAKDPGKGEGGKVLYLPIEVPVDQWEPAAIAQQTRLKEVVRE
jgi:phage terminase small subunit